MNAKRWKKEEDKKYFLNETEANKETKENNKTDMGDNKHVFSTYVHKYKKL